jgi:hypothetical protein
MTKSRGVVYQSPNCLQKGFSAILHLEFLINLSSKTRDLQWLMLTIS